MTTAYDTAPAPGAPSADLARRKGALRWTSIALSIALMLTSVMLVDSRQVITRLESTDARWLFAFFLVYALQIALLGLRWSSIARQLELPLGWRRASVEYSLSILANQLLPTGFAGDGLRSLRHARWTRSHSAAKVLEAVAMDRLSGQLGLGVFVLATLPLSVQAGLVSARGLLLAGGIVTSITVLLTALAWHAPGHLGWLARARAFLIRSFRVLVGSRRAAMHLGISVLLAASLLLQLELAALAVGVPVSWAALLWLGPLILFASSLPSFFGGWGVREGASAMLFAGAGLSSSAGVAVSLVFGAFSLVCAMPGFIALLLDGQSSRKPSGRSDPQASWGNVHAAAVIMGAAMALVTGVPPLLTFVGALSLSYLVIQSRRAWTPSGAFGLANAVTTLRLLLTIALLVGCETQGAHLVALTALLILVLDGVDGWVARRSGSSSEFGARYDTEVDALFVLALSLTLSVRGIAGPWALLAGLWRYLYVLAPLVLPTPVGEAPRTIYYRVAYLLMILSFIAALLTPPAGGFALTLLGTVIISVSFLHSFWRRYVSPAVP